MIHNLLPIVGGELNAYLKSRYDVGEDRLILSNLMNPDGTVAIEDNNKIVCTLLNIQEETTLKSAQSSSYAGGMFTSGGANLNINLTVMYSAFFPGKNYGEALKFLSGVIYFFQSKSVFEPSNTPGLTNNIEKACFDLTTLSFDELNAVYSMLGSKYMPSVIYRVRMLTFSSANVVDVIPSVGGIGLD
jgi:hypothetical protein